jgi:competence protein ComEC
MGLVHLIVVSGSHLIYLEQIVVKLSNRLLPVRIRAAFVFSVLVTFVLATALAMPALRALMGWCVRGLSKRFRWNWTRTQALTISGFLTLPFCSTKWQLFSLALGWIAALGFGFVGRSQAAENSKRRASVAREHYDRIKIRIWSALRTCTFIYAALIPALLPLGVPSVTSILYNLLFAPALALVLFPASVAALICDLFAYGANSLWTLSIWLVEHAARVTPDTWTPVALSPLVLVPYIFTLTAYLFRRDRRLAFHTTIALVGAVMFTPVLHADELIVWNIGQGSWATLKSPGLCQHFDMGGEWSPKAAIKYSCGLDQNEVFFSHWDWDHIGLTKTALQLLPNLCVQDSPGGPSPNKFKANLIDALPLCSHRKRAREIFLSHETPEQLRKLHDTNDFSKVFAEDRVIFPGDSPTKAEKIWRSRPDIQLTRILIAGHHGSKSATSEELLSKLPNLKMIVASAHKVRYGHPHAQMLARAATFNLPVLRTEEWGSLHFELGDFENGDVDYRRKAASGVSFIKGISKDGTVGMSVPSSRRRKESGD